jgi:hypothetical protein
MTTHVAWPDTTASIPLSTSVKAMTSAPPTNPPSSPPNAEIATLINHGPASVDGSSLIRPPRHDRQ